MLRTGTPRSALLAVLLISWCGAFPYSSACASENDDAIESIAKGYLANRGSFASFTCRFKVRNGFAESLQAALDGQISKAVETEGLWCVDGPHVRYELTCDSALLERAIAKARASQSDVVTLPGETFSYIENSDFSARLSKTISSVNLLPASVPNAAGVRITPFGMDVMGANEVSNPGNFLNQCLKGELVGQYEGTAEVGGASVMRVRVGKPGEMLRMDYSFAPDQGYLPVRLSDSDPDTGRRYYLAIIQKAQKFSDDRWFPMHCLVVGDPDGGGPHQVREITVRSLNADDKPDDGMFQITIPAGVQVSVPGEPAYVNIAKPEELSASGDGMKQLYDRCVQNGAVQAFKAARRGAPPVNPPPDTKVDRP